MTPALSEALTLQTVAEASLDHALAAVGGSDRLADPASEAGTELELVRAVGYRWRKTPTAARVAAGHLHTHRKPQFLELKASSLGGGVFPGVAAGMAPDDGMSTIPVRTARPQWDCVHVQPTGRLDGRGEPCPDKLFAVGIWRSV
jgi:hypothetical protein